MSVCCLFIWPAQLMCCSGDICWCWRLGCWDESEELRLEGNVFVIHLKQNLRWKGDHGNFPATELEMIVEELDLRSRRRGVGVPSACLLP